MEHRFLPISMKGIFPKLTLCPAASSSPTDKIGLRTFITWKVLLSLMSSFAR